MKSTFFITTPIYYTNWVPHIWHSYSSIIADIIARYKNTSWKQVKFSTWVDENSQKAVESAEALWMETSSYLDMMAEKHKEVWDWLGIKYTDFIRTTEPRHHDFVRWVLQKSFDNWDIYEWVYEWMYCVWCESFKKDDDLVYLNKTTNETFPITKKVVESDNIVKVCPDHLKEPDKIKEKNYFFKLSKYQSFLEDFYETHPDFVTPSERFNEVIAFVKRGLEDFSISRETNKFGIKLPFDDSQVTYVWYDALFNYLTVCQNWDNMKFWPADLHVVWKDIIRFHAIYWPAMLKSAWYQLPKQILTTGYFTVDWHKISKSLWNVIDPVEFTQKYSKDLLTLYMLSSINIGQDWDFDQKQAILTYNAKLANNLWNLVNRVVVLTLKLNENKQNLNIDINMPLEHYKLLDYCDITDHNKANLSDGLDMIRDKIFTYNIEVDKNFETYNLKSVLDFSFKFLDDLNKYADEKQPWQTIKDESLYDDTKDVLYTLSEWLRQVWLSLYSFFPEKMSEMFVKLWLENYNELLQDWNLKELRSKKEVFNVKEKWEPLFKRIDI